MQKTVVPARIRRTVLELDNGKSMRNARFRLGKRTAMTISLFHCPVHLKRRGCIAFARCAGCPPYTRRQTGRLALYRLRGRGSHGQKLYSVYSGEPPPLVKKTLSFGPLETDAHSGGWGGAGTAPPAPCRRGKAEDTWPGCCQRGLPGAPERTALPSVVGVCGFGGGGRGSAGAAAAAPTPCAGLIRQVQ
eukprot:gene25136-biopygen19480